MGKGLLAGRQRRRRSGSVGLQSGDYEMAGFDEADVVLAIGYDLVEHSPEHWNPKRDKQIICIDSVPAETDANFIPEVELVGDIYNVLTRLGEECRHVPHQGGARRGCATWCSAASSRRRTTTRSRCSRRGRCGRSARRSAATTS